MYPVCPQRMTKFLLQRQLWGRLRCEPCCCPSTGIWQRARRDQARNGVDQNPRPRSAKWNENPQDQVSREGQRRCRDQKKKHCQVVMMMMMMMALCLSQAVGTLGRPPWTTFWLRLLVAKMTQKTSREGVLNIHRLCIDFSEWRDYYNR
jgi:hypothetical protein